MLKYKKKGTIMSQRVKYVENVIFESAKKCKKFEDFFLSVIEAQQKTQFAFSNDIFDKEQWIENMVWGTSNPIIESQNINNVKLKTDSISFQKHFNDLELLKPNVYEKLKKIQLEDFKEILKQSKEVSKKTEDRVNSLFVLIEDFKPNQDIKNNTKQKI